MTTWIRRTDKTEIDIPEKPPGSVVIRIWSPSSGTRDGKLEIKRVRVTRQAEIDAWTKDAETQKFNRKTW